MTRIALRKSNTAAGRAKAGSKLATIPAALISLLLLTSCSAGFDNYADLQRERNSADELPRAFTDELEEQVDPYVDFESARLVGEYDGTNFWIAEGARPNAVCVIAYESIESYATACGMAGTELGMMFESGTYKLVPDGWVFKGDTVTAISENLFLL